MNDWKAFLLVAVLALLTANRASAAPDFDGQQLGCVFDCPRCNPGEVCSKRPCRLICPDGGTPCGPTLCQRGDVCCNPSCGICTAPDGVCTQQFCEEDHCGNRDECAPGFHWANERCACIADEYGACRTHDDCQLVADYCTGCDCRAIGIDDPIPACGLPGVRCFADPCLNQQGLCVDGRCQPRPICVQNVACARGQRWSPQRCACVSDVTPRHRMPHRPHAPQRPHSPR